MFENLIKFLEILWGSNISILGVSYPTVYFSIIFIITYIYENIAWLSYFK